MSTSFKTGDRVELIEDYTSRLPKGTQGTVAGDVYTLWEASDPLVSVKYDTAPSDINGTKISRLKLVEAAAHEYKVGQRVQITIPAGNEEAYGGAFFSTGEGTVEHLHSSAERLMVRGEASKDDESWWVDKKFVTPLAEELPFEVGSRVRTKAGYLGGTSEGIVTRLYGDFGGDIEIAWETGYAVAGFTLGARRSGLEVISSPVVERPKATPVTAETKPQVGDTIVAFWDTNGVEYRQKGVVDRIDADGTLVTVEGNHINVASNAHSYSYSGKSDSVFIVERAPKPEPVKVDPNQKWIDAPLGSIARDTKNNFVWRKTSDNEWSLLTSYGDILRDRNDSTVGISAVLFTP